MDSPDVVPEIKGEAVPMPAGMARPPIPDWNPLLSRPQPSSTPDHHAQADPTPTPTQAQTSTPAEVPVAAAGSYRPQFSATAIAHITSSSRQLQPLQQSNVLATSAKPLRVEFPPPRTLTYGPVGEPDLASLPKTVGLPFFSLNSPKKRKRESPEYTQNAIPDHVAPLAGSVTPVAREFPVIEKPVIRKKKSCADAILVCEKCHATSNVSHNPMMVCKGCFEALHRLCGDPSQDPQNYVCLLCAREREEMEQYKRLVAEQQAEKQLSRAYYSVENQRSRNMAGFSQFHKPQLVGFFAGDSTQEERVQYFSQLKMTDLVNLLIFSEEHVEGGVLASVLASVAKKHHDLPIFNRPDWVNDFRAAEDETEEPPAILTGAKAQATTSLRKPKNKRHRISAIRKLQDGVATIVERPIPDFDENTLPPLWPRPGQGLYSLLKPEKDDALMYDDKDEQAFSHFKGHIDSGPPIRPTFTAARDADAKNGDRHPLTTMPENNSWRVNVAPLDAVQV